VADGYYKFRDKQTYPEEKKRKEMDLGGIGVGLGDGKGDEGGLEVGLLGSGSSIELSRRFRRFLSSKLTIMK